MEKTKEVKKDTRVLSMVIVAGVFLVLLSLFMGFYAICKWFDTNRVVFNSPIVIKIQAPIKVEKRKPVIIKKQVGVVKKVVASGNKEVSEYDIVMKQPHGKVLWDIYMLESTRGKNDGCRLSGEGWGGFGVMVEGQVYCYPSFEKAVERAEHWFSLLEPDKSLVGALCAWNLGTKGLVNCDYYQSYLSLQ